MEEEAMDDRIASLQKVGEAEESSWEDATVLEQGGGLSDGC